MVDIRAARAVRGARAAVFLIHHIIFVSKLHFFSPTAARVMFATSARKAEHFNQHFRQDFHSYLCQIAALFWIPGHVY